MKRAPIAMPIDHIMPMAESSLILPFSLASSIPMAEATAKNIAPAMGIMPLYMAIPTPPNDACVMPPQRNTIRRDTMYVPTIPQIIPENIAARKAFAR